MRERGLSRGQLAGFQTLIGTVKGGQNAEQAWKAYQKFQTLIGTVKG